MSTFFINTEADASQSLVFGLTDNTVRELPTLFVGDSLPINFIFTDGLGGYADFSGQTDLSVKIAIGDLATGSIFVLQDNFTYSDNTYNTTLVLMTDALANAITGAESIDPFFEIQIETTSGESYTVYQNSVTVKNQLITNFSTSSYPRDTSINIPIATLNSYSIDSTTILGINDIAKVTKVYNNSKVDGSTITLAIGEYYRVIGYSDTAGGIVKINFNDDTWWVPDDHFVKVIEPADNNSGGNTGGGGGGGTTDPVSEGTQYYIWGDDNTNGVGYYYPVYSENTGLTSFHTHSFSGTSYYMKDSDSNHAELALPSGNTLPPAANNLEPPNYIQLVWGSNYEAKSSAFVINANKQGYSRLNGGSTASNTSRDIDITSGTWRYNYNGQFADIFSTSIYNGQGIIGDMSFAHTFEIYKYKVTSVNTSTQSFSGGNANRKIGIEAFGAFESEAARQVIEDASLDIFSEYSSQSSGSIWSMSGSSDYGTIVFNQTKNIFYFFLGNETGYIYADTLSETTEFDIDDEIFVLFE